MKFPPHLKRLISMHRPYVGRLALAFCAMVIVAATEPVVPLLFKLLLDKGFVSKPDFSLWLVPLIVVGIFALRGACNFFVSYTMTWTSSRLLSELRRQMFNRLLAVPVDFYATTSVGKVVNSIMAEVTAILNVVTGSLPQILRASLTVFGLLIWLFYLNWKLTLIILVVLPFCVWIIQSAGKRLKLLNQDLISLNAKLTQTIGESTRAHQVIKVFGGQEYERNNFMKYVEDLRRYMMRVVRTSAATSPLTQLLAALALSLVVVFALTQSAQGEITVGSFVSFVTAMLMMLTPMKQLANVNAPLQQGLVAAESVFKFIDTPVERTTGKKLESRVTGCVEYQGVTFSYAGQEKPALKGINLRVEPGETIALVGVSGGGKTTLVNLLPAFYAVEYGQILLDGEPINDISLASLREQIAMVSQHVVLINDTVAANVSYGSPSPDMAKINEAIDAAYLTDVVNGLPQGVESLIGDNGSQLSGGQRQRLAIARAIYKDAPLLILDEATSALDTESERMVQVALERLMSGRTTFVIAHRLSTVERADRIAVLEGGNIVEIGTHAELLKINGAYANLYRLQFSSEA